MPVQYVEKFSLQNRGPVDQAADSPVDGTLLVGTDYVLEFEDNISSYGSDSVYLFPAFHNGARSWLRRDVWGAEYPYSASGTQEEIISFEEGVKLFLKNGAFSFPVPVSSK